MENTALIIEYREYFTLSRFQTTVQLALEKDLPNTILQNNAFIVLTIVASVEDSTSLQGNTVVVISLPTNEDEASVGKMMNF